MSLRSGLLAAIMAIFIVYNANAQSVTSSLGWSGFVEGISPVPSTLVVTNVPVGTVGVSFYIDRYNASIPLENLKIDYVGSDGWSKQFDMGKVQPGATLTIAFLSLTGDTLGNVLYQQISTTPRPFWLEKAQLSEVEIAGRVITMNASYPIDAMLDSRVPGTITAVGNRRFSLFDASANLGISYNIDTRSSEIRAPFISIGINVFDQKVAHKQYPVPDGGISLDENFNLRYEAADSIGLPLFAIDMPTIRIPIASYADLEFDAGIKFWAALKGRIVVGNDGDGWGFLRNGDRATSVSANVYGLGTLQGTIRVLFGLFSARGTLYIHGVLGGGVDYVSIPQPVVSTTFGGNLDVSGELRLKVLWWTIAKLGPKQLYETSFGKLPGRIVYKDDGGWGMATTAVLEDPEIPEYAPQPYMNARAGNVGIVWMEKRGEKSVLWFSAARPGDQHFSTPNIVTSSASSPGSPCVAMTSGGSGAIAWTQSRYTAATVPASAPLIDLLRAQDVWVAPYDASTGNVGPAVRIPDDTSSMLSGRAEAEPRLCMMDESHGLVAWMALNAAGNGADLWYSEISRSGNRIDLTHPGKLSAPAGVNRSPVIINQANGQVILLWIHESSEGNSTPSSILMSTWDGKNWSPSISLFTADSSESLDEIAASMVADYGAVAWTSTHADSSGLIEQRLRGLEWDGKNGSWRNDRIFDRKDTGSRYASLTVSVSGDGRTALSYQVIPRASDSLDQNRGTRYLSIRDAKNEQGPWTTIPGLRFLSDTASFVWDAQSAFADDDHLYVLTEEKGIMGGVRLGSPSLGLTVRAIRLTDGLTVEDAPEPDVPTAAVPIIGPRDEPEIEIVSRGMRDFEIAYRIERNGHVVLELFDLLGRRISTVVDQDLVAGRYRTSIHADGLSSGLYLLRGRVDGSMVSFPLQVH